MKMDNHSLYMPENCSDGMKLHAMELVLLRCVLFSVQFYIFYCTLNNSLGCQCNAGKEPACCWGIWVGVSSDIRFSRIIFQTLDTCMIYNQAYFCCIRLYQHISAYRLRRRTHMCVCHLPYFRRKNKICASSQKTVSNGGFVSMPNFGRSWQG